MVATIAKFGLDFRYRFRFGEEILVDEFVNVGGRTTAHRFRFASDSPRFRPAVSRAARPPATWPAARHGILSATARTCQQVVENLLESDPTKFCVLYRRDRAFCLGHQFTVGFIHTAVILTFRFSLNNSSFDL